MLGFERFAKPGINLETEHAFEGAKRVLGFLASRSPQAKHYLDILNSLSAAIAKQHSRVEPSRANRYVSRLFSFGSSVTSGGALGERMQNGTPGTDAWPGDNNLLAIDELLPITGSPSRWPGNDQIDPELFIDWETVNISHWDNFPFSL